MSYPVIGRDYAERRAHRTCQEAFGSPFPAPVARDPDAPVAAAIALSCVALVVMYLAGWL